MGKKEYIKIVKRRGIALSRGGYMMLLACLILVFYAGYVFFSGGDKVIAGSYLAVGLLFGLMLLVPRRKN